MFKDPAKAATMLFRAKMKLPPEAVLKYEKEAIHVVVKYLTEQFADLEAPPYYDRPIGLQEVETVLCKWKSHLNGHYPLYNDIDDINEGLEPWRAISETADKFANAMPKGGQE